MKFLKLTVVLLSIAGFNSFAFALGKDNIRKISVIKVNSLDTTKGYEKSYSIPNETMNKIFSDKLDSLVSSWYVQNAFLLDSTELAQADTLKQTLPDSVYVDRLQKLQSAVSLSYNNTVKNYITMYTVRKPKQVAIMLGLANYYFPLFEEALTKYGLPMELKYLPIIESALNPCANSIASAVGLWQFMYSTGKMYKLEISTFVDERKDPIKATDAAVKYLRDLYNIYKDWHLVIAAYNCGPGNVNKAIKRCGDAKDYWKIYYRLPKETRGYVPAFIAANYVMNFYQNHNILPKTPDFPIITDTLMVNDYLHFDQISEVLGIPVEQIRSLNPQYRRDIIPASKDRPYSIVLPQDEVSAYLENQSTIFAHRRTEFFPDNQIVNPQERYTNNFSPGDIKGRDKLVYIVKRGDNFGAIASKYKVRVSDIRYWNGIHKNYLKAGQKLAIYVPQNGKNGKSLAIKQKTEKGKPETTTAVANNNSIKKAADMKAISSSTNGMQTNSIEQTENKNDAIGTGNQSEKAEYIYYRVSKGDNFWSIAKKFPGVTNDDIMRLNNITKASGLKVGQILKILPKA